MITEKTDLDDTLSRPVVYAPARQPESAFHFLPGFSP